MKSCVIVIALMLVSPAASLAALSFSFTYVDDASGTFASRGWLDPTSLFQQTINAAADELGQLIDSDETILITVDTVSFAARAGGTFSFGQFLGTDGEGNNIWEQGPLTRILTGDNPGATAFGYDILLGFDAAFVESNYWFDPLPQALVLTSIVIELGTTALLAAFAVRLFQKYKTFDITKIRRLRG